MRVSEKLCKMKRNVQTNFSSKITALRNLKLSNFLNSSRISPEYLKKLKKIINDHFKMVNMHAKFHLNNFFRLGIKNKKIGFSGLPLRCPASHRARWRVGGGLVDEGYPD